MGLIAPPLENAIGACLIRSIGLNRIWVKRSAIGILWGCAYLVSVIWLVWRVNSPNEADVAIDSLPGPSRIWVGVLTISVAVSPIFAVCYFVSLMLWTALAFFACPLVFVIIWSVWGLVDPEEPPAERFKRYLVSAAATPIVTGLFILGTRKLFASGVASCVRVAFLSAVCSITACTASQDPLSRALSAAAACLTIVVALRFGHAPVAASAPQAGPVWTVVPAPTGVSKGMADQTHETTGGRFGAVWKEGDKEPKAHAGK